MKKYLGFVAVSLFLLSCTNTDRDNPYDMWGSNYMGNISAEGSSSSVEAGNKPSSSSVAPSSSSSIPSSSSLGGGYRGSYGSLLYEDQTYKTVVIGTQTWMAENLNYNASDSKCYGDNSGGDSQNMCGTYGRLYNWATALTVCPAGWHLPTRAEWNVLGDDARKLKATSGWNNNGNGTDDYGFSALPGGLGTSVDSFDDVGYYGFWWSASEYGSNGAFYRDMISHYDYAGWNSYSKSILFSVRCVQD